MTVAVGIVITTATAASYGPNYPGLTSLLTYVDRYKYVMGHTAAAP
jgi:hypothetical protein